MEQMLPSDAARFLGVSADSVRRYEAQGKLPARRTAGPRGIRLFDRRDVEKLARERAARKVAANSAA